MNLRLKVRKAMNGTFPNCVRRCEHCDGELEQIDDYRYKVGGVSTRTRATRCTECGSVSIRRDDLLSVLHRVSSKTNFAVVDDKRSLKLVKLH